MGELPSSGQSLRSDSVLPIKLHLIRKFNPNSLPQGQLYYTVKSKCVKRYQIIAAPGRIMWIIKVIIGSII